MRKRKNKSLNPPPSRKVSDSEELLTANCLEGQQLSHVLQKLGREIELAKQSNDGGLPEKIWIKQQFSIGVNEVTRVLERMPKVVTEVGTTEKLELCNVNRRPIQLQVVLLAVDCKPKMLINHIPSLTSPRRVPIICIRDKRGGSLRLGELLKLKTAIAIGVKCTGSRLNAEIDAILRDRDTHRM